MPRAAEHRWGAGISIGIGFALYELNKNGEISLDTVTVSCFAFFAGTLPDILEPALNNPNHRQFFHSLTFGLMLGYAIYKLWKWEPKNALEEFLKIGMIATSGAYLVHLIMDAGSPRGLPVI